MRVTNWVTNWLIDWLTAWMVCASRVQSRTTSRRGVWSCCSVSTLPERHSFSSSGSHQTDSTKEWSPSEVRSPAPKSKRRLSRLSSRSCAAILIVCINLKCPMQQLPSRQCMSLSRWTGALHADISVHQKLLFEHVDRQTNTRTSTHGPIAVPGLLKWYGSN